MGNSDKESLGERLLVEVFGEKGTRVHENFKAIVDEVYGVFFI